MTLVRTCLLRGTGVFRSGSNCQRLLSTLVPARQDHTFDVAVIGGGVVGCAVLRALTLRGFSAVLLEKHPFLAGSLASGGNTGIACTAAEIPEGSLERQCVEHALRMNGDVYRRLNIPHEPNGTLYVAWNERELERLQLLTEDRVKAGERDARMIDVTELRKLEPNLSPEAVGAMFVPGEVLVDPWLVPIAWAHHALENGASIHLNCPVHGVTAMPASGQNNGGWHLLTADGDMIAQLVINCGGLWADEVEGFHRPSPFGIKPKRGDYVVFGNPGAPLLSRPIGQVPTPDYRGVYVWQTLHGNFACGPTAEFQDDRENAEASQEVVDRLREVAIRAVPALRDLEIHASYSGLRPATDFSDYQIEALPQQRWIAVGGIRSTGLTASLGIGEHVCHLVETLMDLPAKRTEENKWSPLPSLQHIYHSFQDRGDGSVDINGMFFTVTHPLSKIGYHSKVLP